MTADGTRSGLVKAVAVMGGLTIVSRVLGLIREIVRAHFLGTSIMADAFTVAFMIPNLFRRLVGEGAMTVAAVPVLVEEQRRGGAQRLREVANSFFTLFTFILTTFAVIFIAFAGILVEEVFARGFADNPEKLALTVELTRYMFFYIAFIGLAAVCQAILNSGKVFGPSAFTPILLNLSVILSALFLSRYFDLPVYAFAVGVLLGGFLQLIFQIPYLRKVGVSLTPAFNWRDPAVQRILKLMLPGIVGAGVYQINVLISQMIATYLADGAVSSLQYSARLTEFTLGVFIVSVSTAILPTLSAFFSDNKMDEFRSTLRFALRLVAFVTIPAMVGMIVIRYPLINLLFRSGRFDQVSTDLTAYAFFFHILGLYFIGAERMLAPVFFSMKDTVTPVKAAAVSTVANIVACLVLAGPLSQGGIALANSISALVQAAVLAYYLRSRIGPLGWSKLFRSLLRVVLAALLMGVGCWWLTDKLNLVETTSRVVLLPGLLLVIGVSTVLFALFAWLLRCDEFQELWGLLRRRFSGRSG